MLTKSSRLKASSKFAAHLRSATIMFKVICIFSAAALLLIMQVKAQEKTDKFNAFVQLMRSEDEYVHSIAFYNLLSEIKKEGKEAVPALIAALKDQDEVVRRSAAFTLGEIEEEAK